MSKVLVIAHLFPPSNSVGSVRVRKFVKYLPSLGWQPVVVTVPRPNDTGPNRDPALLAELPPGLIIEEVPHGPYLGISDVGVRWAERLAVALPGIIAKHRPDVVFCTGRPFLQMPAVAAVCRALRVPYVIDLRDPWSLNRAGGNFRGHVLDWLNQKTEPATLRHAARIVVVAEQVKADYCRTYPALAERFVCIENGYDPADIDGLPESSTEKGQLVYIGKFMSMASDRDPRPLFEALKMTQLGGADLRLKLVGPKEDAITAAIAEVDGAAYIEQTGVRPYREALATADGAEINLIVAATQHELTTKLYEYMGIGKPILGLAPEGSEMAKRLRSVPFARVVTSGQPDDILAAIRELQAIKPAGHNNDVALQFSRIRQAGQLADVLNQIAQKR